MEEAAIDDAADRRSPAEFASSLLAALNDSGPLGDVTAELANAALSAISVRLDESLWRGQLPESLAIEVLTRLPELLKKLEYAGFGEVTSFGYFWEGFLLPAWQASASLQAAVIEALRTQWSGGEACRWAVIQGLESLHGTNGAVGLAEELRRTATSDAEGQGLERLVGELRSMYGRRPTSDS
jgi:hypothetical protein